MKDVLQRTKKKTNQSALVFGPSKCTLKKIIIIKVRWNLQY